MNLRQFKIIKVTRVEVRGSIILILVWVYYTSLILYIGAEFTQVYAEKYSTGIEPSDNAVHVKQVEVKKDVAVLPAQNQEQTQN